MDHTEHNQSDGQEIAPLVLWSFCAGGIAGVLNIFLSGLGVDERALSLSTAAVFLVLFVGLLIRGTRAPGNRD